MPLANNLTPAATTWTPNVPQLETTTQALGGPGGPMNEQAQALLDRTEWLYNNLSRFSKGVTEMTGNTTLVAAGMNKAYFIDTTVTTQISVALPDGSTCEDGDAVMFRHTDGIGSMEIDSHGGDDFLPASGSWFLLTPGDYVIFVLKKGAVNASKWLPVASYNYIAPTASAWTTRTLAQSDVTPSGGDTIASGFSGKFRYKKDSFENILHFTLLVNFVSTGLSVSGIAVQLSAVLSTPSPGMYVHRGSGECSGFPVSSYINGGATVLNIYSIASTTLAQGGNVVAVYIEGQIEVNP